MKLKYDKLLSGFAFKFNLRRYTSSGNGKCVPCTKDSQCPDEVCNTDTGSCQRCTKDAQCPNQVCDTPGITTGNCKDECKIDPDCTDDDKPVCDTSVGRCRLTVSKPVLKARLVSALETKM